MSARLRRTLVWAAQLAIFGFVAWRIVGALSGQWETVRLHVGALRPRWLLVLLSTLPVLASYALLVEAWRRMIVASGSRLDFAPAWRIYMVSKLGVYVPGRVWQIAALGVLSRRAGVPAVAAGGAAIVGTVTNIAAGFAVLLLGGTRVVRALAPRAGAAPVVLSVAVTIGLILLPLLLPPLARLAARRAGRAEQLADLRTATLGGVVLANVLSWIGYGVGFALFIRALLPGTGGDWIDGLTLFTGSYLAGYLALVVPGGVGVREAVMAEAMTALHVAAPADAWILALASRLWLTVLEVVPGLVYLARDAALRSPPALPDGPRS